MLTATQQHAVDEFAKSLSALGDDALIDTYHQVWEDHREASAEGSDNLSKAYAKGLATEKAMQDRLPDYQASTSYAIREPVCYPVPIGPNRAYRAATWSWRTFFQMLPHHSIHR